MSEISKYNINNNGHTYFNYQFLRKKSKTLPHESHWIVLIKIFPTTLDLPKSNI